MRTKDVKVGMRVNYKYIPGLDNKNPGQGIVLEVNPDKDDYHRVEITNSVEEIEIGTAFWITSNLLSEIKEQP